MRPLGVTKCAWACLFAAVWSSVANQEELPCHTCLCHYKGWDRGNETRAHHNLPIQANDSSCRVWCQKNHPVLYREPYHYQCQQTGIKPPCILPCPYGSKAENSSVCDWDRNECPKHAAPKSELCIQELDLEKTKGGCDGCYQCDCSYTHGVTVRTKMFSHIVDDSFCRQHCNRTAIYKINPDPAGGKSGCEWHGEKGCLPTKCPSDCTFAEDGCRGSLWSCAYDGYIGCACPFVNATKVACHAPEPPPGAPIYNAPVPTSMLP